LIIENKTQGKMTDAILAIPTVAIQWLIENASSDVDLARLSNVCREWRRQVALAVSSNNSTSNLLLPSMVRFARCVNQSSTTVSSSLFSPPPPRDTFCAAWFAPKGIQHLPVSTQPLESESHLLPAGLPVLLGINTVVSNGEDIDMPRSIDSFWL
jgi:hypothetical protein